jgi:hypothetical protein
VLTLQSEEISLWLPACSVRAHGPTPPKFGVELSVNPQHPQIGSNTKRADDGLISAHSYLSKGANQNILRIEYVQYQKSRRAVGGNLEIANLIKQLRYAPPSIFPLTQVDIALNTPIF